MAVRLLDVPTAVWVYVTLRGLAVVVPLTTGSGGIGLGAFAFLVGAVFLVRGSRFAWIALLALDAMALVLLAAVTRGFADPTLPLLLPILQGLALLVLFAPSIRRHVTRDRAASDDT